MARYSFIFLVVFVTTFAKAQFGNNGDLGVTLHNVTEGSSSIPGSNGEVELWLNSSRVGIESTNSNNSVLFQSISAANDYEIRAFHNSLAPFGKEYWGRKSGVWVNANQTNSADLYRYMPYFIGDLKVFSGGIEVTGQQIEVCIPLEFRVTIKSRASSGLNVKVEIKLDRSRGGSIDKQILSSNLNVPGNGTREFRIQFTPDYSFTGNYYAAIGTYTQQTIIGPTLTDGSNWTNLPVIRMTPGDPDLVVINPDINVNEAYPGDQITVECEVENQGCGVPLQSSYLGYFFSSQEDDPQEYLDRDVVPTLDPSQSSFESQTVTIPSNVSPGYYYIVFVADHTDDVNEGVGENNNISSERIYISDPSSDLDVYVHNVVGGQSGIPGSDGLVKFYGANRSNLIDAKSTSNQGNGVGRAAFRDLDQGSNRLIEVFYQPGSSTIFGDEFWGRMENITIPAPNDEVRFDRYMPHTLDNPQIFDANGHVTNGTVYQNSPVIIEVDVLNRSSSDLPVDVRIILDKDKQIPYDFDLTTGYETIAGNGAITTVSEGTVLAFTGDYYSAVATYLDDVHLNRSLTSGSAWSDNPIISVRSSLPPIADANNISNAPGSMYPNVQYAVTATYSDPNGVDDLFKCYLKLKHPTGDDLTLEYNADNGTAITLGNGWNYINVDEVAAQSNGNELTLTWKYTLNNNWQGAEGGIDFGVRALDDDAGDSGWSNRTVNGAFKWYGVTIITHGHTPPSFSGNQIDDWVFPMALKIWDRVGRCGTITTFDPVFGRLDTLAQGANINGESIVIADWIEESKHLPSGYSESSADAIFAALVRAENRGFLRLENIHLIGHSRGTVVNSEIVDRILQGIENYGQSWSINQVTNLDAHDWGMNILNVPGLGDVSAAPDWDINGELVIQDPPLRQPNRGAVSWLGIEWGDSYWQIPLGGEQPCFGLPEITPNFRCGKLAGRHVLGTALFPELPNSVDHGGVHEWYLGTIDTNLIIGDSYWYGGSMPTRSEGYNYSRVGGRKQRPTINEPREPREPWGHNFRDGIYNGDFSRGVSNGFTSAYDDLPVPGWGWGTGYSYTAKQNEGVLVFEEDHQVIEHNYFWIPLTAKEIWFQYHILLAEGGGANNTDRFQAELEILEPHNISIPITTLWLENETQYPIWNNLSGNVVDISQYQGSIARLRMALADYNNNGLHSKIWVDDIHFNLGPSVQSTPLEAIAIVPANSSLQYTLTPTFEWSLYQSGGDGESQSGYQVRVRIDDGTDRIIYDTGYIQAASGNSHVFSPGSYSGLDNETGDLRISEPLQWGQQYHWHVRYRDSGGDWGPWSHDDPDPHQIFFTNSPGTITAISPDGGEFRNPINLSVISGDPDPNSSIVSLEYRYSINGGNSWIPIGTDHTPDDPLAWNPTISTDHVLLCARANDGYLWSEWKVGENEVLIDNDPPVTTDNVPAGWQNSPFTVLLTADDNNGSGFDNTGYSAYSINGSTPLIGNAFDIESSGNHQIAYFSVDDVGNLEPMRISNHIAQLDLSNPIFQGWSQVPADLNTNSSGVLTVSVEVIETLSGIAAGNPKIQYRFDNNAWSQYYQMQAEGGYLWSFDIPEPSGGWQNRGGQVLYYRVRAEDVAGNTGVSAAQSVQIENIVADTPPVLTWSGNANFVDDGVHPQKAIPGNSFRFEVQYKDVNNDPPASGYPKLHLLFDGNPVVGSPFAMIPADNAPFSAGRNYFSNQVLSVADSTYSYFFEAPDQVGNPATGLATQPQRGILVNTPPLVSSVFISPNNANEEDQLLAYANYSDGDGHTVELRQYEWFRNGQYIAGVDTNILFPQEISAGDEIAVRITPWDGYEEGITGESVPITIHPAPRRKIHVDADNTGGPWDGSKATPFHNIQDGIDYAVNGDTVFVNSGWYFENIRISKSLILLGQNPQTTLIDAGGRDYGIAVWAPSIPTTGRVSGFTIQNSPAGSYAGIFFENNPHGHWRFDKNFVINNPYAGLYIRQSNVIVANNTFANTLYGIAVYPNANTVVENNTLFNIGYYGLYAFSDADSVAVQNNILLDNYVGMRLFSSHAIDYNDVFGSTYDYVDCTPGAGNISQDPQFAGPLNFDFRLLYNSPAIDAGNPASLYNDLDGTRNDIGAYGGKVGESYEYPREQIRATVSCDSLDFGISQVGDVVVRQLILKNSSQASSLTGTIVLDPSVSPGMMVEIWGNNPAHMYGSGGDGNTIPAAPTATPEEPTALDGNIAGPIDPAPVQESLSPFRHLGTVGTNLSGGFPIGTESSTDFDIQTGNGAFNLLPGDSLVITLRFSPADSGIARDFLSIEHNASNLPSPYLVNLSGQAVERHLGPDWFVSAYTGSDSTGFGSEPYPFASIQAAIDQLPENSIATIHIGAGVYSENLSIDQGKEIRFRNQKGVIPRLAVASITYSGFVYAGQDLDSLHFINRLMISGPMAGVVGVTHCQFDSLVVFQNGISNLFFRQNLLKAGLQILDYTETQNVVQNNTIFGEVLIEEIREGTNFINNIVVGDGYGTGVTLLVDENYAWFDYNCIFNFATSDSGLIPGPNTITTDPLFSNDGAYYLTHISPAIDAGTGNDLDGSQADLGMFGGSRGKAYVYPLADIQMTVSDSAVTFGDIAIGDYVDKEVRIFNSAASSHPLMGSLVISSGGALNNKIGDAVGNPSKIERVGFGKGAGDRGFDHQPAKGGEPFTPANGNELSAINGFSIIQGGEGFHIPPGGEHLVVIRFEPSNAGFASAALELNHRSTNYNSPYSVSLNGTAYVPYAGPFYISQQSGDDQTGDGSISLPFQSIQKAVDRIGANRSEIIYIAAGIYQENLNFYPEQEITLKNWGSERPQLDMTSLDYLSDVNQKIDSLYFLRPLSIGGGILNLEISNCRFDSLVSFVEGAVDLEFYNNLLLNGLEINNYADIFVEVKNNSIFGPVQIIEPVDGFVVFESNIVVGDGTGTGVSLDGQTNYYDFDYNCIFQFAVPVSGDPPGGNNLFEDPLLGNFPDYQLTSQSPAIDAGRPNRAFDPDGSRNDLGWTGGPKGYSYNYPEGFGVSFRVDQSIAVNNDGGASVGISWIDADNDGDLDLYVANRNAQNNFFYRNQGAPSYAFSRELSGEIVSDGSTSESATWGDKDNDGDMDLFLSNLGDANQMFRSNGDGTFSDISRGDLVDHTGDSRNADWGDWNGDGLLDLYVAKSASQTNLFYKNWGYNFQRLTDNPTVQTASSSFSGTWVDYDGDFDQDLFVTNSDRANQLFENQGNGTFVEITSGALVTDQGYSQGASWGDYDNDGDLDVYVTNAGDNQANFLYNNQGSGAFARISQGYIVTDGYKTTGSVWGDFDNDGDLDLVVSHDAGQPNILYRNEGYPNYSFTKTEMTSISIGNLSSRGLAAGDMDNDGDLDLALANLDGDNRVYENLGNEKNWLKVQLQGRYSNAAAIGAVVSLYANLNGQHTHMTRHIASQSGMSGQSEMVAHFGLGDANLVDSLVIRWPSGVVQRRNSIAVNQKISLEEVTAEYATSIPTGNPAEIAFGETGVTADFHLTMGGSMYVKMYGIAHPDQDSLTISRFWDITSSMDNGLFDVNLTLGYDPAELNGLDANLLVPAYLDTVAQKWFVIEPYTVLTGNRVSIPNLRHFTIFTLGLREAFESFGMVDDLKIRLEDNDLVLSWSAVPDATSYRIHRWTSPYRINPPTIGEIADTTFTDTNVAGVDTTSYFYRVRAISPSAEAALSPEVGKMNLVLEPGWNLVSLPVIPGDASIGAVIGDQLTGGLNPSVSDIVYQYTGQGYQSSWYHSGLGQWFGTLTQIETDKGYWINILPGHTDTVLTFVGAVSDTNRRIPIQPGWNMVGSGYPETVDLTESNLIGSGFTGGIHPGVSDIIYEYRSGSYYSSWYHSGVGGWFGSLATLKPGQGYWIYIAGDHSGFVWNYSRTQPQALVSTKPLGVRSVEEGSRAAQNRENSRKSQIKMKTLTPHRSSAEQN